MCRHSHGQINDSCEMCQLGHNSTARYLQSFLLNTIVIRNYLVVVIDGQSTVSCHDHVTSMSC
jgi:hypothetical protein